MDILFLESNCPFVVCNLYPQVHDLVFHLPRSARYFKTIGGVREDSLEAKHAQGNDLGRRYASVKNKAERLRLMLQGAEAGERLKAVELRTPLTTRRKRKDSSLTPRKPEKARPPLFEL